MSAGGTAQPPIRLFLAIALLPSLGLAWVTWGRAEGLTAMGGHMLVVRDYAWFWGASALLGRGDVATIFDPHAFADWLRGARGTALDDFVWSYPPPMLLLAWPARLAGIVPGFVLFGAAQIVALCAAGRLAGLRGAKLAVLAASPAVVENALAGQNGALVASLLAGGLLLAKRRPLWSGMLLGALAIKPQAALLVPICLLASRNGRAAAAAMVTVAALTGTSLAAFGPGSFAAFWTQVRPYMTGVLTADWQGLLYQRMMVSGFMAARSAGAGVASAAMVQAALSVTAAVLAWRLWRDVQADGRETSPERRVAVTLCLAILATPYGYTYDMAGVSLAAVMVRTRDTAGSPTRTACLALAWIWPGLAVTLSLAGLPDAGCVAIAGLAWAGMRPVIPSRPSPLVPRIAAPPYPSQ